MVSKVMRGDDTAVDVVVAVGGDGVPVGTVSAVIVLPPSDEDVVLPVAVPAALEADKWAAKRTRLV
jgi:hypothetical protein